VDLSLTDEQFNKYFSYLQVMSDDYTQWSTSKARKEHIDSFGIKIEKNEVYYKRQLRQSFSSVIKLSKKSMQNILFMLVEDNILLQNIGEDLLKHRKKLLEEATSSIPIVTIKGD